MGLIPPDTQLPESDRRVKAWDETDPRDRPLFARHMETYAAMLDCVDQNLGKLVGFLRELGELGRLILADSKLTPREGRLLHGRNAVD